MLLAAACKPSSVAEAEQRGNVAWLDDDGSPAAVEALGRLADKDGAAVAALKSRAPHDVNAYIAAWAGVKRGARWGSDILHTGFQDPDRAETAASAVSGQDPAIAPFVPDIEASIERVAATGRTFSLAAVLAAAGPAAHEAVVHRLNDKATRGAMCGGIAGPNGSADARAALRAVPSASRDDATCVTSVVTVASTDDVTLHWLAREAEPGLIGAASRLSTLDCSRAQRLWTEAIAVRARVLGNALTVPLSDAIKRCPAAMDGVLADAIRTKPDAVATVVGAFDPFSPDDAALRATCQALPLVASSAATPVTKERAANAVLHGCTGAL
jgi:hypothetical protein